MSDKASETPTAVSKADLAQPGEVGPAQSSHDLVRVFRLLYENRLHQGHCAENRMQMHVPPFALLPDTMTFVAKQGLVVATTVSVFPDGPFGLPLDDVFGDLADELRSVGRRVAEVGMLADRRAFSLKRLGFLVDLFNQVYHYNRLVLQAQDLCAAVPPSCVYFYERYLCFRSVGGARPWKALNGTPVTFLRLKLEDLLTVTDRNSGLLRRFAQEPVPREGLIKQYRPTLSDLELFLESCPPGERRAEAVRRHLTEMCALLKSEAARGSEHATSGNIEKGTT